MQKISKPKITENSLTTTFKFLTKIAGFSTVITLLSWLKKDFIDFDGLFMPTSGPDFWAHGFPWWYGRCYLDTGCELKPLYFLYSFAFWFVFILLTVLIVGILSKIVKSVKV